MQNLFECNNFTADERRAAREGAPARIFFLTREFIAKYWAMAGLPPEELDSTVKFAAGLQNDMESRALVWHLYNRFCVRNQPGGYPEELVGFGRDTGRIYLLLLLALTPFIEERAVREGFPLEYAQATAKRIGTTTVFFAQKFDGAFGIRARSLGFMLNYKTRPCFRIGRFDFEMWEYDEFLPEIYVNGDQTVAICQDGWRFDARGERTREDGQTVRTTRIVRNSGTLTGTPVDPVNGYAEKNEITLDLARWRRLVGPGDWTVHFHIPSGGGMTPEICAESFAEAKAFFANYFPDKPARIIWTNSWFFNPAYKEYLPESNIAKLSRSGLLFPVFSSGKDGLFFVFGREDDDFAAYECRTSLQKAVLRCQREHGFLRRTGWFMRIK